MQPQIDWQRGPLTATLAGRADLVVPPGCLWATGGAARAFLDATGNPPVGDEVGVLASAEVDWFAVFTFDSYANLGFVRGTTPNVESITRALRAGGDFENREREKRGRTTLHWMGWRESPAFDASVNALRWSLDSMESDGRAVVNRFTLFLLRDGVLGAEFVTEADGAPARLKSYESTALGLRVRPGFKYKSPVERIWWAVPAGLLAAIAALVAFRRRQRGL